jgi:hypothetical protein
MKYKLLNDEITKSLSNIILRDDGVYFPMNEANTDYQAYLKWLDEGNTPEQAD